MAYAVKKGAVVVAAVGNADEAYTTPWPYASWPSALPHVIGVGALTHSGDVPDFSDEDPIFVDLAAPGVGIFSTFPKDLTNQQPACAEQGYTGCAAGDFQHPEGTSFSAPQVSAAAAVLLGLDPTLTNSQVTRLLERHTDDVNASNGCSQCSAGRDKYSGWGRLDVTKAVNFLDSGLHPPADRFEPNDSAPQAHTLWGTRGRLRRDPRLLGRPGRRLPREARGRAAPPRADRRRVVECISEPDAVAAGNDVAARAVGTGRLDGAPRGDADAPVPGRARRLVCR